MDRLLLRGREGLLMVFEAFFDQSDGGTPRHFVISGYVGRPGEWRKFERQWRNALAKDRFPFIHWADLEGGYGDVFGHLHGNREAIETVHRRYIKILNAYRIHGFCAGIDLDTIKAFMPRLTGYIHKKYDDVYFYAFQLAVGRVIIYLKHLGFLKPSEKIAFIFDRPKQFKGRAHALYDRMKDGQYYRGYLGPLAFEDKTEFLPIQAADVIAWESMHDCCNPEERRRWQMKELMRRRVHQFKFEAKDFARFAELLETHAEKSVTGRAPSPALRPRS